MMSPLWLSSSWKRACPVAPRSKRQQSSSNGGSSSRERLAGTAGLGSGQERPTAVAAPAIQRPSVNRLTSCDQWSDERALSTVQSSNLHLVRCGVPDGIRRQPVQARVMDKNGQPYLHSRALR